MNRRPHGRTWPEIPAPKTWFEPTNKPNTYGCHGGFGEEASIGPDRTSVESGRCAHVGTESRLLYKTCRIQTPVEPLTRRDSDSAKS
eukprot:scaffold1039_cov101-Cylindrotheca_fusiformis.AAC.2